MSFKACFSIQPRVNVRPSCRIERFVGLRQYASVAVQVAPWELSEGLEASAHCPSHLYQWATKEGVQLESSAFVV